MDNRIASTLYVGMIMNVEYLFFFQFYFLKNPESLVNNLYTFVFFFFNVENILLFFDCDFSVGL